MILFPEPGITTGGAGRDDEDEDINTDVDAEAFCWTKLSQIREAHAKDMTVEYLNYHLDAM